MMCKTSTHRLRLVLIIICLLWPRLPPANAWLPLMSSRRNTINQNSPIISPSRLYASAGDGDGDDSSTVPSSRGQARFRSPSTKSEETESLSNPLDDALTFLFSDPVSIALGLLGLLIVVAHRLQIMETTTPEALTLETRTDLLGVFACGSVLLNGITNLDVTTALAESVVLEGSVLANVERTAASTSSINDDDDDLPWVLDSILKATPAMSAVILRKESNSLQPAAGSKESEWEIVARAGVVPASSSSVAVPEVTPILDRVGALENTKETYLPTLQALPGKKEFPYLPANTQLALLIPFQASSPSSSLGGATDDGSSRRGMLVLGSNTAKSFSPRDIAWCRIAVERL